MFPILLQTIQRDSAITFPMFGDLTINPPAYFTVFGKNIYFYGVIIGLGFILGMLYCARRSRDFGLVRLAPPSKYFGMGDFVSDDGRSMLGFVSINDAISPPPYGQTWARSGFIWRYGEPLQYMSKHGIADVEWYGLSADGQSVWQIEVLLTDAEGHPVSADERAMLDVLAGAKIPPEKICVDDKPRRTIDHPRTIRSCGITPESKIIVASTRLQERRAARLFREAGYTRVQVYSQTREIRFPEMVENGAMIGVSGAVDVFYSYLAWLKYLIVD